jgi:hypothetical protein
MWITYPHQLKRLGKLVYRGLFLEGGEVEIRSYPLIHSPYYYYFIYLIIYLYKDNSNRAVDKWITSPIAEAKRKRRQVGRKRAKTTRVSQKDRVKIFLAGTFRVYIRGFIGRLDQASDILSRGKRSEECILQLIASEGRVSGISSSTIGIVTTASLLFCLCSCDFM